MIVIMVHWLIRKGQEEVFKASWRQMSIDSHAGLYREILTTLDQEEDNEKFHTFSIGNPHYSTFLNIGFWESVEHFDKAIDKYIPKPKVVDKNGKQIYTIELQAYEFKLRERVVLNIINDRGGDLPAASIR